MPRFTDYGTRRWRTCAASTTRSSSRPSGLAAGKGVIVCDSRPRPRRPCARDHGRARLRRGRRRGGHRGAPGGPEVSLLAFSDGATSRHAARAGPQARLRRRPRAQHRRHGRLSRPPHCWRLRLSTELARSCARSRSSTACAAEGTPYVGVLYAGLMLTRRRAAGAGVQLPLRRPRDAGHPAAAGERPGGRARGLRRRPAGPLRVRWRPGAAATVVAASGATRAAIPRAADHRPGRGRAPCPASPSSTPARARADGAAARDRRRARAGGHRRAVPTCAAALARAYAGIEHDPLRGHALPPRHRARALATASRYGAGFYAMAQTQPNT